VLASVEKMRADRNAVSKKIPTMSGDDKKKAVADMKALGTELEKQEEELTVVEEKWKALLLRAPQIPHPRSPVGKSDADNKEARREGSVPVKFAFASKDHVALGETLDIIDFPRGAKIGGARSYFLKGDGARLELAVLHYAVDQLVKKGQTLFTPPVLVNAEALTGTGFFPGNEENTYMVGVEHDGKIESDKKYLVGTSEVPVASYHMDETVELKNLPLMYAGISNCFRREAGSYGKDTKGLYRVHQFQKVEQVVLCEADEAKGLALFEEIRGNAEQILKDLGLPYRILDVCTGDMGQGKVCQNDIETWMPSRNGFGETMSCSYLGDFQARRLNIKYETAEGERKFVHTLNNTCVATPRLLIPILEIYQNKDGSVTVPEVLRPYMGGQSVIKTKEIAA
jgi:seryl-tRNA synthetase